LAQITPRLRRRVTNPTVKVADTLSVLRVIALLRRKRIALVGAPLSDRRNQIAARCMSINPAYIKLSVALASALFTTSASGQSPANKQNSTDKGIAAAPEPRLGNPENKVAAEAPKQDGLRDEIDAMKAQNAAALELFRKMEEQQKTLLQQVERLQRRLDGRTATDASAANAALNTLPAVTNPASTSVQTKPQTNDDRYQDGIIIAKTRDDARVPFLLTFNNNTQIRYLNTLDSNETFADHLGNVHEVHRRNDITVNRSMFILGAPGEWQGVRVRSIAAFTKLPLTTSRLRRCVRRPTVSGVRVFFWQDPRSQASQSCSR